MDNQDQNQDALNESSELTWWIRFEPVIIVGAVVLLVLSLAWFVNDPSYEPLTLIITGLMTLLSINSVKNKKVNWLLAAALVVAAVVGIIIISRANDPDEIVIVGIYYDGEKDKEGDEYVVIRNEDTKAIQLEGWTLQDDKPNHIFTFPRYKIEPGEECRIYTNEDHLEWCGFNFRNGGSGVWNNDGDMATLRNADGEMIDSSIDEIMEINGETRETTPEKGILLTPTLTANYDDLECIPRDTPRETGQVVGVLDGRTIEVELGDGSTVMVRYLGIATIVEGQPLFEHSVEINKEKVLGKSVSLVEDVENMETDGILLRYVFVENSFVNSDLVRAGYAVPVGDFSCAEHFINMMIAASEDSNVDSASPTSMIVISNVFFDGEKNEQEPDEFVEIQNNTAEAIDLEGWTLSDESGHVFSFPDYVLNPDERCRVFTNETHNDWCSFNFESLQAIWGNKGDCATLKDREGSIVYQSCYD